MASFIGNDILDIGIRKARLQQDGFTELPRMILGNPGQFDVPNVADVSVWRSGEDGDSGVQRKRFGRFRTGNRKMN